MKLSGNTIFITGGGSGIGRGLAEAFYKLGNKVIISGRRRASLDAVMAANPGIEGIELDIRDPSSIDRAAARLIADHPNLNVLINNAGIMLPDGAAGRVDDTLLVDTVTTNLVGPIRVTSVLVEHLKGKDGAVIAYTSSALGFVPLAFTAVYSATKAALHSYALSQRFLLRGEGVRVLEIAPPWVRTDLMNSREAELAMPLDQFIAETMSLLGTDADEIVVDGAMAFRINAGAKEHAFVDRFNRDMLALFDPSTSGNSIAATHTHQTAPTRFVEANGIRFAYRRFGNPRGVPIVLNQHFKGSMDYWDPAVTDGLGKDREVILFDNAGIASSSGEVPTSIQAMGANAIAFVRALGLAKVDVLGFSIGGMVAQEIALQAADLVRKLILVGTGPRGADLSASKSAEIFAGVYDPPEHLWLAVNFSPSDAGRAAGLAFLERKFWRSDRDSEVSGDAASRQREAIGNYIVGGESAQSHLKDIRQPTLIVQGSNDVIIPPINSYVIQQKLPNAQLVLYPDANHGSFYQYPGLFVKHATLFLDA